MAVLAPRFVVRLSPSRFPGGSEGAKRQSGFQGIKGTNLKGVRTWRIRNLPYRATWRFNMKMVKSLILGSATALVAMSGAQAADLPVKAKAVEYVMICSLYGAGFYYIPGTDTCIKIGGYLRVDTAFNGSTVYDAPAWSGDAGQGNRWADRINSRSRMALTVDTRTASEYGVVRTFMQGDFQFQNFITQNPAVNGVSAASPVTATNPGGLNNGLLSG